MSSAPPSYSLKPPLPAPLSHQGIRFIFDQPTEREVTDEIITVIAATLNSILPAGDLFVDQAGAVRTRGNPTNPQQTSLWYQSGLLAGIERSSL